MSETLLDRAMLNFQTAKILFDRATDDERLLNMVGYHLQQAVELAIKFLLERAGMEYPKVHDIGQLIKLAGTCHIDLGDIDYIDDHAEMFTAWEAKTRYVLGYLADLRQIQKAMPQAAAFLDFVQEQERLAEYGTPEPGMDL